MTPTNVSDTDSQRRAEIISAARSCFRRWGIARTRMDDIAEVVGIVRPNLYCYFPSKEAVIQAVMVEESRRINLTRRATIAIEGPVAPVIARSIIDGLAQALDDEYLMDLMTRENVDVAAASLGETEPYDVRAEYWQPILDHGRRRNEIRPDLDDHQIVRWLGSVQLLFLESRALYPDIDAIAADVHAFVVPSITVGAARH